MTEHPLPRPDGARSRPRNFWCILWGCDWEWVPPNLDLEHSNLIRCARHHREAP